jgi:hypothetical protein
LKIYVDDIRPAPEGYVLCRSVNETIKLIERSEQRHARYKKLNAPHYDLLKIELIDLDHDAGEYASDGRDFIKILDWLEETGRNYPIRIHTMNPVGRMNMRAIIVKNNWKEITT